MSARPLHPLDPIFSPKSIAVVGASRRRDSLSHKLVHNLVMSEFNGAVFPVNPSAPVIQSHKAYPSMASIPDPVDLAVIMVPSKLVQGAVEECIAKGVRGLVVITAGFAETGAEGAERERLLVNTVQEAGVRMIGPNSMGVINADPEISMDATFSPTSARNGSIGFVSQSGALGVAILNAAADLGIGLTQFVSVGNKADVTGTDMVEYWEHDDKTRVICMYLESFGSPRRFTQIAKRVSRTKPILVVKSGRTVEGARAASSHTGAIAGADVTISVFLEQCGVMRANTIDEMFDIARAFERCPLPKGKRVGILTNAGGPAIMATDACVNLDLEIATFSDTTRAAIADVLPVEASPDNPVDMIASATGDTYASCLDLILQDDQVDMALVVNVTPILTNPIDIVDRVAEVTRTQNKPVVMVVMATDDFYDEIKDRSNLPPVYRFPESAARALAQLQRHAAWRERPVYERIPRFDTDDNSVSEILSSSSDDYLDSADAIRVLEHYGIPVARWESVDSAEQAAAVAAKLGFPVALKAVAPGLVHKSDVGGVRLGLEDASDIHRAIAEMDDELGRLGHPPEAYLVQEMAAGGHEVIFGITTDPRFGPLLMFGLGGKYVEVFRDVRFGVTPLVPQEAEDMIRGIRGFKLLEGVRGEESANLDILEDVLMRIAQLAERHPEIIELDINPFLAGPDRASAKALDVRIRVGAAEG